jgi:hypothetical protein
MSRATGRPKDIPKPVWIGIIVAAIGSFIILVAVLGTGVLSKSYPHPWCGPVLAQLNNQNQTVGAELAALKPYANVPLVGRYRTATVNFGAADSIWRGYSNGLVTPDAIAALNAATKAGNTWKADTLAIRAACR